MSFWRSGTGKRGCGECSCPADFPERVAAVGAESMVCHRTTMECLLMNDRVEKKAVRTLDAHKYSTDLDYRPQEFRKETLRILADAQVVGCGDCSGRGQVACRSCSGNGEISCNTTEICRSCRGSGEIQGKCMTCGGTRKVCHRAGALWTRRRKLPVLCLWPADGPLRPVRRPGSGDMRPVRRDGPQRLRPVRPVRRCGVRTVRRRRRNGPRQPHHQEILPLN